MTTPLPKRDERSAPKFDSKNEALLPNFFEEFERTAKAAGIIENSEKMKRTVLGYLDAKTMKFWQSLDTFDDDEKTWEEFKTKILDYYPGATGTAEVTTEELVRVVETYQKKLISTTQDLAEYHREFAVVAKALRTQGTLSEILIAQHYVRPFPENIRTRIDTGLYVHYPTKKVGQAYTINEIRKVVTFLLSDASAPEGDGFYVARESHSIRAVNAIIGGRPAHCILDGGCSIVVMSDSACNAFGLAFDLEKRINLQSANGNTDWSLGLAKDIPFRFGDIVAFLQVQVVDSPAYDFILGRPFKILMQASYKNFLSGDQHLTLTDPNTHKTITIPTAPREPPRFRKEDSREYRV
ncbi:hypothetical protein C8R41DRAFT_767997 [Lentinula lateritia]|uniref:Retrotransposon gag domain-containing protein n=1 Tax=Lentinula lateritia TaxID=40482 RepID=A0ABQ8VHP4_9AGAR|nr:hypothetical protein C8R41DRAFT_767997 [Lentinula lateritia]